MPVKLVNRKMICFKNDKGVLSQFEFLKLKINGIGHLVMVSTHMAIFVQKRWWQILLSFKINSGHLKSNMLNLLTLWIYVFYGMFESISFSDSYSSISML